MVKELRDTEDIKKLVDSSSDIVWNSVPAAMELFIDSLDEDYKNDEMKAVLLSGDWINVNLPDKIKKHFPKAAIFSLGGATEASIWSIYYPIKKVDASWTSIPYGYPLTNQSIYILDSEQRICPPEVIGEIYIGGIGVAKGYINDEEKLLIVLLNQNMEDCIGRGILVNIQGKDMWFSAEDETPRLRLGAIVLNWKK